MKSIIEKAFFLKRVRVFAELDLELLLAVAEKLYEDDYDAKEVVFHPNQVANRIYFLASGSVDIFDEKMKKLTTLQKGDFFGDESIFNNKSRSYHAICTTDVLFYTISRSQFLSVISECPSVAVSLLQDYSTMLPCRFIQQSEAFT